MVSKDDQLTYKGIAAGTSSGLSMVGSIYILGRYWYSRRIKSKSSGAGTAHHVDVTKELIHVLAWLDLIGAAGRCFGVLPTQTFDQSKGEPVTSVCQLQAYVISFGDISPIAWNFIMAYNLFRWVCLGEDQQMLQRRIKWYVVATLAFTLTIDTLALGFHKFGDAGQWCWIVVPGNRTDELYWKLITLYIWVLLGGISMSTLLMMVRLNVQDRLKGVDNDDARLAYQGVVHNLTIYIGSFILCWCPAVLDRGYSAITGHDVFALSMLHTSIVPLQGFVNAVIYGKFHVWIGRHMNSGRGDMRSVHKDGKSSDLRSTEIQERERKHFGTASIFVTSFDLNWSPFPQNLSDWIPPDKDVYVFSLQHCFNVQIVEQSIRKHLLQINYPMGYRSITSLAGTQLRGHMQDAAVCQIIFVNNSDIASGNFQFQTADGRLWSQRKTFKGVVGIPMRYFEASLAFVSCNLGPISSYPIQMQSYQQEPPLATKHAITSGLIHSFEMAADRAAVDFPYLYHHTILAGNLNYNIDMTRPNLASAVDHAYKAECLKRATDAALNVKLRNFGQCPIDVYRAGDGRGAISRSALEPANSNVPVEWNLLYFKSRKSLGRASLSSNSSCEDEGDYEEVFSANHDGLPFTQLQSPARATQNTSFVSVSGQPRTVDMHDARVGEMPVIIEGQVQIDMPDQTDSYTPNARTVRSLSETGREWMSFLNGLFPSSNSSAPKDESYGNGDSIEKLPQRPEGRGDSKKVSDWMTKSELVAETSMRKWQELLRFDELRAAIEAKEVLCGFEEPPITFLPSYPRRVGVRASYSMLAQKSCKDLFDSSVEKSPSYKDRILVHSLPDTKQRIRNVGYWLCEDVLTSTHKPVCSVFELEIDRFFAYTNKEADVEDMKAGKLALKEKTDIQEFKIKLVNLDANIWTYLPAQRNTSNPRWRLRGPSPDVGGGSGLEHTSVRSGGDSSSGSSDAHPQVEHRSTIGNVFGKMKRRHSSKSINDPSGSSSGAGSVGSTGGRGRLESISSDHYDLVPIEPLSIATVFPLPSEDVYALQRKVYEVAHSVQSGFQASARDEEGEEASLAYTNFRSISWKEATTHGVMHSAITKAVNGVIHVAIKIEGDNKSQGGQGILCIEERDLVEHAAAVIGEADPIPFDLPLTWGGKHVGFLHGDILSGL